MAITPPGALGFQQLATAPVAPPAGFCIIYSKTDNVLYLKDSSGIEVALGTASGITQLTGDVTALGPGSAAAVVAFVGGKTALEIADSVDTIDAATSVNFPLTLVKRDASGNFSAGVITANLTGSASNNVLKSGDTMSGDLNLGGNQIKNMANPSLSGDAANKNYVDTGLALKFDKTGGTLTGAVVITDNSPAALVVDGDVFVVDGTNNRVGINKLNPTEALDVVGNGQFTGTIVASNFTGSASGTNTGDVTVTDTFSINLSVGGQNLSADVRFADTTIDQVSGGIRVAPLSITNAQIALAAAIAYSKLDLSNSILDSDINAAAGIVYSKLNLSNSITDSDILTTANILRSKLASGSVNRLVINDATGAMVDAAAITANRALISDADGIPTHSITTDTELSYVNGVTSSIQTQLNDREILANKAIDLSVVNNILYPTTQAVQTAINSSILFSPIFMLSGLNSDISGYKSLIPLSSFVPSGLFTISQTVTTSETLMEEFATNLGVPNVTAIPSGIFSFHYELQKSSGPQLYYSYVKLFKRSSGGVETLLLTSDNSSQISSNSVEQISVVTLNPSIIPILTTDRIIVKIYAIMVSGSQSITLRYDDNTDARAQYPGTSLNFIPENVANKSTDGTLSANSLILYPSQSAVKTYADTKAALLHASQHLPSGSDPLTTAAPVLNLSASTTNDVGTADSFSRSDHSHDLETGIVSSQIPDQTNAEGSSANLARADHVHNIPSGTPVQIGTSNFAGAAASFALSDHVHSHGNQTNGSLHAAATVSVNGFMSAADKTKLDNSTSSNTASTIVQRDVSGNFSAGVITADLIGTATNFSGSLSGDVTGTQSLTVVSLVGGKTSTEVSTSVDDTIAATSANTASTIVKRSAAGLIELTTQQLNGSTSGNIQLKAADVTTSYEVKMPAAQGVAGTYLSNDGLGNLTWSSPLVNIDGGRPDSVFVLNLDVDGGTP